MNFRIFTAVLFIFLWVQNVISVLPARAADRESKQNLEHLKNEMEEQKKHLKRVEKKEKSILSSLERIDREIQAGSAELALQQRELRLAETALSEIEQKNAGVAGELGRLRTVYAARLKALYKLNKSGGYAAAILTSDGFSTAYRRMRFLASIAERDQRLIREYGAALEQLVHQEEEARKRREEILARKTTVEAKRLALEMRRRQKAEILASVKQEKGVYEATLKDLEESSANLWAMIRLAEQEKKTSSSAAAGPTGSERLPWPINGKVLTGFGMQRHPQFGTMVYRRGIDIDAHTGDEVRAVDSGQVVFADWYRGYGVLVILEHKDRLYTLYGHLSRLSVQRGDQVERGQVIGFAGDTGSLRGTKLYFEIRKNGEAVDPLTRLVPRREAQR